MPKLAVSNSCDTSLADHSLQARAPPASGHGAPPGRARNRQDRPVCASALHGGAFSDRREALLAIECAIADVMGLIRTTAEATGNDEYEARVGIDWTGAATHDLHVE